MRQQRVTHYCELQIVVANISGEGKKSVSDGDDRQFMLYPFDTKNSAAFSPYIFGHCMGVVLPLLLNSSPITETQNFSHPWEGLPRTQDFQR